MQRRRARPTSLSTQSCLKSLPAILPYHANVVLPSHGDIDPSLYTTLIARSPYMPKANLMPRTRRASMGMEISLLCPPILTLAMYSSPQILVVLIVSLSGTPWQTIFSQTGSLEETDCARVHGGITEADLINEIKAWPSLLSRRTCLMMILHSSTGSLRAILRNRCPRPVSAYSMSGKGT